MNVSRFAVPALLAALAIHVSACAETKNAATEPKTPAAQAAPKSDATASTNASNAGPRADASVETPGLHVSDAIARACGLTK